MKQEENSVTVVIHPSGSEVESLTVADAMQQVLDAFELLTKAQVRDDGNIAVVWRLKRASTNSPFTVEATPEASDPSYPVQEIARAAVVNFQEGMDAVLHAKRKPHWMDLQAETVFRRILARNLNGIGETEIFAPPFKEPIKIDQHQARRADNFLEFTALQEREKIGSLARVEYGSVDGHVTDATTWRDKPAFRMKVRVSGRELVCVLPEHIAARVGRQRNWQDVFTNQRVIVSGACHYNAQGILTRIEVDDVQLIEPGTVTAEELADPDFTSGRSVRDHLKMVWGGDDHG